MSDENKVLLRVSNLKQYFPIGKKKMGKPQSFVKANDGISLNIYEGETFGLVGESGCGKSTFGRTLLQLYRQTGGRTVYYGRTVEDFDLKYVEEIFKNLPDKKKKCEELLDKVKKLEADYAKMSEGSEEEKIAKKAAGQHLAEMESEANNDLLDITALIGGLYTLDESALAEAGRHYLAEYLAMKEIRKINAQAEDFEKNGKMIVDANGKPVMGKKVDVNMMPYRKEMQMVFQDPYSSLNPRMTVEDIIGEPLDVHKLYRNKKERREKILDLMELVGLNAEHAMRYAHEFSGGQRQRIGIARALAVNPKFIVCDEAVSALDVSIQAQVVNMFEELQEKLGVAYLFIAHDLLVVHHISDRIAVMYLGKMMEIADADELNANPIHPYTLSLLSAVPIPDPETARKSHRIVLEGDVPSPLKMPTGCPFRTRCKYATEKCGQEMPQLTDRGNGHMVACWNK